MARLRRLATSVTLAALAALALGACNNCELEVATTSLPEAQVGVDYATFLQPECGGDTWFLNSGSLPPGIGLRNDGLLSGTPTLPGDFGFTVGVYDFSSNETAFGGLVLHVRPSDS